MKRIESQRSSGDVYRDPGFSAAEAGELPSKALLSMRLGETIERRALTQKEAAALCGADQPTLSKVFRGRMESVTIDRLAAWLAALGRTVEIRVRPYSAPARSGQLVAVL